MFSGSIIDYVIERLPELWTRIGEHLMLSGCSTLLAILIGIPIGILVFRTGWLRNPILGAISTLQTIPSLAMLVFLLALLQKIGVLPALIALTVYALLPIVRNTLTGLEGVSPELIEAARGIGMTEYKEFAWVRMPLSTPIILAGIRTAAVVGVGIATLSAFIGAGGLGQFINRGLALSDTRLILLGAIPAAILALIVDSSIGVLAWALRPENKRYGKGSMKSFKRISAFSMPLVLVLICIFSYLTRPSLSLPSFVATQKIRIGTKNYTEQLILGELMAQLIEAKTDMLVERRFGLGGTMICHGALLNGEIDLYAEYTGTALTAILNAPGKSDSHDAFEFVAETYHKKLDLIWLRPFGFNNTYAITIRGEDARRRGWKKISDLHGDASRLRAGFTAEFAERPDGYPGLKEAYGLTFGKIIDLDPSLMYEALSKGEVDVICAFSTDGRIAHYNLKPLEDDRHFFPPYQAAPVINGQVLRTRPQLKNVLCLFEGRLDNKTMQRLNFEVDGRGKRPAEVAGAFLKGNGLLEKTD